MKPLYVTLSTPSLAPSTYNTDICPEILMKLDERPGRGVERCPVSTPSPIHPSYPHTSSSCPSLCASTLTIGPSSFFITFFFGLAAEQ